MRTDHIRDVVGIYMIFILIGSVLSPIRAQTPPRKFVATEEELIDALGLDAPRTGVQTKTLVSKGITATPKGVLRVRKDREVPPEPPIAAMLIHFKFDSAEILPESYPLLQVCANVLQSYPEVRVTIAGHTDSIGPDDYNFELSWRRANAVRRLLVAMYHIDGHRLDIEWYGETAPIASNEIMIGRALNRRVEFMRVN